MLAYSENLPGSWFMLLVSCPVNDVEICYCFRHDFGTFYPVGDDGSHTMIGEGLGAGYNINVPWENGRCGDADYLAVWDHILLPVAEAFNPDLIMISAGFDAG